MLAWWMKLMPYILVEWLSKNRCERMEIVPGYLSSNPFKGVIFSWKIVGFFEGLSPEQKAAALAWRGEDAHSVAMKNAMEK